MKTESSNNIAIIDYKAGNAPSVERAVTRLGYGASFARHPDDLALATHILLPGVGNAKATMQSLHQLRLLGALEDAVLGRKTFFMGICVGLQILFEHSAEDSATCLGWLKGRVTKFNSEKVRVPQMGWNQVKFVKKTDCAAHDGFFYFVNSYYAMPEDMSDIWGAADYGATFAAAVNKNNIYGTQFHIEKSGEAGLSLLKNFLALGQEKEGV